MKRIIMIGAGNVGTQLGLALHRKGYPILQVYSRTQRSASELAKKVGAEPITALENLSNEANIYIIALKDDATLQLLPTICKGRLRSLFIHTAGSIAIDVFKGITDNYGVLYPLQTFSKDRDIDFINIPIYIEGNNEDSLRTLENLASDISTKVSVISSTQRQILHLSAVWACNFSNYCYSVAEQLLAKYQLSFDVLLPLIDETTRKIHHLSPLEAQTGPAVRSDEKIMNKQLELLEDSPLLKELYDLISKGIINLKVSK